MSDRPGSAEKGISNETAATPRGKLIRVWLIAVLLTCLTILVHLSSPSTLHQSEEQWIEKVNLHISQDVFRVRPLATNIVQFLVRQIGLPYRTAFFGLQFLLFFPVCPVFYFFLRQLGYNHRYSTAGMIIYAMSLSLFLAHFEPIHTWSDFWVYLMIPLSLGLAIRRNNIPAALVFSLALVARESSILFIPILFWIVFRQEKSGLRKSFIISVLTVMLFLALRFVFVGFDFPDPEYDVGFNFDGALRASDSIFSLIVSLGFIWVVGLYQSSCKPLGGSKYGNILRFGALFTTVGFVLSAFLYGHVRESRLFHPPAILLIPLTLTYIQVRRENIKYLMKRLPKWAIIAVSTGLLVLSILAAKLLFPVFEYRAWRDGNWFYLGLHISLTILFLFIEMSRKYSTAKDT